MAELELSHIGKRYGDFAAVDDVSISVAQGEMISLLGPSGCGKTTTLRMIAGFITPDSGAVLIKGQDTTFVPAHKRNTGMVFQSYALWPHMSVFDNVAFGLQLRKLGTKETRERVDWALELVQLKGMEARLPGQLSGGQQQRVALARALAIRPAVLLLDEPLSNLDRKLRDETRLELIRLQHSLNITTVYVTHDQEEALTMSDRVAVMNRGRLVQMGSPAEIYDRPASRFVADFIGKANFISGTASEAFGSKVAVITGDGTRLMCTANQPLREGEAVDVMIRPERLVLHERQPHAHTNVIQAQVAQRVYMGVAIQYHLSWCCCALVAQNPSADVDPAMGDSVYVELRPQHCLALPRGLSS